jgi:TonB-dependent receptor
MFRIIALTISLLSFAFTQAQTVRLNGKITNEKNEPLVGVSVNVPGIKGTTTDVEGRYSINLTQGKKYEIVYSTIGYSSKKMNDIEVIQGQDNEVNVVLERVAESLEGVVVRASSRKQESIASLLNLQKNSSAISDGISADVIKRSPDRNTGEVLKRVSGASVQDNKFVVIRGLSERYNVSLLNNSVLPSTEADKKAFAFDIIPSSIVDNLIIYKSPTPDLPGDFAGGAIKVLTKDYPSRSLSEISVSVGYNSLTTGKNFYKSKPNGSLDAVGFFDDSRLIPGPYYRDKYGFINKTDAYKTAVTKMFPNTFGYQAANKSLPNVSASYTGGNTSLLKNGNKLGYIYSVGYSNGRALSERERTEYDVTPRLLYDYNTTNYDEKNNITALLNLTYSYGKSKISFKNLFNNNFVKNTALRDGSNFENFDPILIKSLNSEAMNNGLVNSVVEGLHQLSSSWTVDWNGSYAYTYKNQPDQRIITFRTRENETSDYFIKLNNQNSPEIRNAGRVYSFLAESIYGGSANATKKFEMFGQDQKLKIGTMNYYRDREVEVDALGYASLNMSGAEIHETKDLSYQNIFSPANVDTYRLTIANIATNSTDYTGNALMNAGYVMLDNKFTEKVKLTWGARVEKYHQELQARGKNKQKYDNTDVLPSLLFTYSLTPKTNIRVAGSQAVNRPEFRELADYSVYDYESYFVIRGNPNLQRAKISSADLRYEWFPSGGEIISASAFYKYFDKPIEQTNLGNDILSFANADKAVTYCAEIELRKKLDFIGGAFFNQLSFYANAAYIKGNVQFNGVQINSPMQGQSPYLINGGLTYISRNDDFGVNVLYNRIGPRLRFRAVSGAAFNIFEKPRDVIDMQVSKKLIAKRLELKLTVSDILAQAFNMYYKFDPNPSNTSYKAGEDKIINSIKYGTTGNLSVRYTLSR